MATSLQKKRILWIDYVKAFAIITVIMLHIPIRDPYMHVVRSFVIPIFFFLSGLFSHPERYQTLGEFLKNKTFRLLFPYFIFSILNYLYWLLVARHFGVDAGEEMSLIRPIYGILLGFEPWLCYAPLWFLPCLILTELLFYATFRVVKGKQTGLGVIVISLSAIGYSLSVFHVPALPYGLGGALSMSLFYYSGYLIQAHHNWEQGIHNYIEKAPALSTIGIILFCTSICIFLSLQTAETKVFINSYGNLLYALPATICGCISIMGIAILLYKHFPMLKILQYIGTHTMTILGLHLTVVSLIKGITVFILRLPLEIYEALWARLLLVVATVFLCIPFCYLYEHAEKHIKGKLVHQ